MAQKLSQRAVYVIYGAAPPVKYSDKPRAGFRAGVSRMLGAELPCQASRHPQEISVAELFAGGLGGWTHFSRQLEGFKTVCAVDFDSQVTPWFASNNGAIQSTGPAQSSGHHVSEDGFPLICVAGTGRGSSFSSMLSARCSRLASRADCGRL